eukprot:tig00020909_g15347.t1
MSADGADEHELSPIELLPPELLHDILIRCDLQSLLAISASSRRLAAAAREHSLWRELLKREEDSAPCEVGSVSSARRGGGPPIAAYIVKRCIFRADESIQAGDALARACLAFLALSRSGFTSDELVKLLSRWACDPGHRFAIDTSGVEIASVIDALLSVVGPFLLEERVRVRDLEEQEWREDAFLVLPSGIRAAVLARAGIPDGLFASESPESLRLHTVIASTFGNTDLHPRAAETLLFSLVKLERYEAVASGLSQWAVFEGLWIRGAAWEDPALDNIEGLETAAGGPHPYPGAAGALQARRDLLSHLRACEKAQPGALRNVLLRLREQGAAPRPEEGAEGPAGRAARLERAVRLFRLGQFAMCCFLGPRRTMHFLAHREPVTDNEAGRAAQQLFGEALELLHAAGACGPGAPREEALLSASAAHEAGYCLWNMGLHEAGVPLARRAFAARAALLGHEDARTADSLCKLALLLHDSLHFADAERCLSRALATLQGLFTPAPPPPAAPDRARGEPASGPSTPPAQLRQRPASPVQAGGPADPAPAGSGPSASDKERAWAPLSPVDPVRAVLKHCRGAALPPGHEGGDWAALGPILPRPHALLPRCLNDLGRLYSEMGQADAARDAHAEALAIRESTLGVGALDCSQSLLNLGVRELDGGEYWFAFKAIQRSVHIRSRCLGPDHVLTRNAADCLSRRFRRFLLTLLQQQNVNIVATAPGEEPAPGGGGGGAGGVGEGAGAAPAMEDEWEDEEEEADAGEESEGGESSGGEGIALQIGPPPPAPPGPAHFP